MANANGHGGKRAGAGRPSTVPHPTHGGKREGAGRTPGVSENISPARLLSPGQKWGFAELALRHAEAMLAIMVDIAVNGQSEAVRLAAADKVIDRAMGKAPAHIDITAMRHTDIVYQSAEELRAEFRKALEAEGVPRALLDLTVEDELEEPSAKAHFCPGESRRAGLMFSDTPGVRPAPSRLPPWVGCGTVEGRPAPARLPPCPFAFAIIASGLLAS